MLPATAAARNYAKGLILARNPTEDLDALASGLHAVVEANGVVRGDLRVAHPIGDDDRRKLEAALGAAVGKRVEARVTLDPTLVGGFVARVGDHVFDASITRQLARMRDELLRAQ